METRYVGGIMLWRDSWASSRAGLAMLVSMGLLVSPSGARDGGAEAHSGALAKLDASPEPDRKTNAALAAFSDDEVAQLEAGKSVRTGFDFQRGHRKYHAGLAYRLVQASPMDVMRALRRPGGIQRSIPYGIEAKTVREENGYSQVRILQGKKPIVGEYTVRLHWDLSNFTARFWLDPNHAHDIVDLWGAFSAYEVRPGWTLVSFRFAFNIGGVGEILNNKAQRWALTTADKMAVVVEEARRNR